MLGGLSLSFSGQVEAVTPLLGAALSLVFAGTNDLAALLALNEVISGRTGSVRRWAWVALILSGGTALGLNTWHAVQSAVLPTPAAVLAGAEPVLLAWVLSHVVALVVADRRREADATASESTPTPTPVEPAPGGVETPRRPQEQAVSEAPGSSTQSVAAPAQPAPELAPATEQASSDQTPVEDEREALPSAAGEPAESLPVELIDRAEKLDRKALADSGGKRGLSYRDAPRRLGVRYATARAALDAARARMAEQQQAA
jgi:hypothetical protein